MSYKYLKPGIILQHWKMAFYCCWTMAYKAVWFTLYANGHLHCLPKWFAMEGQHTTSMWHDFFVKMSQNNVSLKMYLDLHAYPLICVYQEMTPVIVNVLTWQFRKIFEIFSLIFWSKMIFMGMVFTSVQAMMTGWSYCKIISIIKFVIIALCVRWSCMFETIW